MERSGLGGCVQFGIEHAIRWFPLYMERWPAEEFPHSQSEPLAAHRAGRGGSFAPNISLDHFAFQFVKGRHNDRLDCTFAWQQVQAIDD